MIRNLVANPYAKVEVEDQIAVIWLAQQGNNVKSISAEMISAVLPALDQIDRDPNIRGAILMCSKKDFILGIDMADFFKMGADEARRLGEARYEILGRIQNHNKPFVAAIQGACAGAGLELILACRSRLATNEKSTTFAAPEVRVGLLPAGGTTYRLPKLIGINPALGMLLTGRTLGAYEAWEMGLVDQLCQPGQLLEKAKEMVQFLIRREMPKRKSHRPLLIRTIERFSMGREWVYKKAYQQIIRETQGKYPAPLRILECVRISLEKGRNAGSKAEMDYLESLLNSPEARELIRIFSNMKEMKKRPQESLAKTFDEIVVLGAGLIGRGVSETALHQGLKTTLIDLRSDIIQKACDHIRNSLSRQVDRKMIPQNEKEEMLARLQQSTDYQQIREPRLIIEAIPEELSLKQMTLEQIEKLVPEDCIFASGTSTIPIKEISARAERPSQVIGMHFFAPVTKMPLLEIATTDQTADWVVATALQFGHRMGKICLKVKDSPGFYTTRLLSAYLNESLRLLQEGVHIVKVDKVMRKCGYSAGPFEIMDEIGIDIADKIVSGRLAYFFAERGITTSPALTKLLENGYLGRKNKKGFYQYDPETHRRISGKLDEDVYSYFGGSERQAISSIRIQHRLSLSMINEAARCLEEGIIESCRDGDMGAILGLGFPPFAGGPFRYIDSMGASKIVHMLQELEEDFDQRFKVAEIIRSHAETMTRFYPEE